MSRAQPHQARRPGLLLLALLALWVQVLAPPGFMVSQDPSSPGLVICTGHGALELSGRHDPGKAPQTRTQGACVFAGHGLANTPPPTSTLAAPRAEFAAPATLVTAFVAPGQGLAAPPPPARGPPLV